MRQVQPKIYSSLFIRSWVREGFENGNFMFLSKIKFKIKVKILLNFDQNFQASSANFCWFSEEKNQQKKCMQSAIGGTLDRHTDRRKSGAILTIRMESFLFCFATVRIENGNSPTRTLPRLRQASKLSE